MKNVSNIKAARFSRKQTEKKKFITASSSFTLPLTKNSSFLQDKNVHDEAHKLMKKFSSPKDTTKP
jgi:hypothetical protein